ncbi:hypothetical protein HanRHA438_Chr14g0642921 [Helianthus annuus]|uniref:Uncharacterized protein n=1 Tax=Helianthus annuus TaxID=4232 RepID=A0A9K3E6U0_HELAN|nr:hypothetical protein HanXRQr2_Chr14g0631981 [Helianthus annuus]KAJ0484865.1 hypothetical protein HanHA89_Chr14g0561651 [Helianthus annuus]KAJ0655416.1 hypothetical protein HanLR1_Chr14g0523971 [Helianthus annuus]KAJ0659110.1 hypothetical protein HanOQP8_Chr14g0522301 [Helianthus annuus]KAJ0839382.1 hypothetical protein HanPSC8_Chr14g0606151 [Helianthus annuus]
MNSRCKFFTHLFIYNYRIFSFYFGEIEMVLNIIYNYCFCVCKFVGFICV